MNPYNCSRPGNLFVGYSDERKRMLCRIVEGKSYGLLGGRRCGKTSFLLQLKQDINGAPAATQRLLPRLLDMQEVVPRSPADFFGAIYRVSSQDLRVQPWEGAHYQDFLNSLDRVRAAIEKCFGTGWVVVLLIDELDSAADRLHDSECFQNLRNLLMVSRYSRNFRVVASGVSLLSELITDRSSPLNNLDPSYLGILSLETARELVKSGFKEGFQPSVEAALFERTGRHPYVLQGVLEYLWDAGADVDESAIKNAAQRFVRDRNATFRRWLHDFGQDGCAVYQGLLDTTMSITQLRSRVPRELSVDDGLRILSYHGAVDDSDPDALRMSGSIFRDWFRNNFTPGNVSVPSPTYEMASVLFMDIVSYSLGSIDDQADLLTILQKTVRESAEYTQSSAKNEILSLPTGDGMALVFLRDPVSPVKCALEIAGHLQSHPQIKLRMGIHTGPVRRHADIKEDANVVGGGINTAQRVMDCGDAGHILLSRNIAEVLEQMRGWSDCLQDLGVHEVKHGVKVHLYNLCKDGVGNAAPPRKVSSARSVSAAATAPLKSPAAAVSRWKWLAVAGAIVALAAAGFVWSQRTALFASRPAQGPIPKPEHTLRYFVNVQRYRNGKRYKDPFRLSGERVFHSDYQIRLTLIGLEPGYLYVLSEGPESTAEAPDLHTLFPSPGRSAQLDPRQKINIPQDDSFKFDDQKSKEKLWLVWSTKSLPELEALNNNRDGGAVQDAVRARAVLELLKRYGSANVHTEKDETNLMTILRSRSDVFARFVQLEHD